MRRKAMLKSINMSKLRVTLFVLILLPMLVPCEVFAKGKTTRVSVSSTGVQAKWYCYSPSISYYGRYVAFESDADNLVDGDSNIASDIFVHDRKTGQTTRVSVSSTGAQANSDNYAPTISSDGRYVAFYSFAFNLVDGDSNIASDIFVHDRQTGQTTRVSISSTGVQANSGSDSPSISSDGRYVAFESVAYNLVDGDTNGWADIFMHDRQTGQTTLVSVMPTGGQAYLGSYSPSISSDGRYVAFQSLAKPSLYDIRIFVHDRQTGQTKLVSLSSTGVEPKFITASKLPSISSDGRYVAFESNADNLVDGDTNHDGDIFVHDRQTGQATRVSVSSTDVQANSDSSSPSISSDGRYVAFVSGANNLVDGDSNGFDDIFVHDRFSDLPNPFIADFKADFLDGFSPLTVQFTDLSSGSINSCFSLGPVGKKAAENSLNFNLA